MRLIRLVRRSVGVKLIVGFWITILLAIVSVWLLNRWLSVELEVGKVEERHLNKLTRISTRLQFAFDKGRSIDSVVKIPIHEPGTALILFNNDNQTLTTSHPRLENRVKRDIVRLSEQSSPLIVERMKYRLLGPKSIQLGDKQYQLFIYKHSPPKNAQFSRVVFLLITLFALSLVFSIVFTRSLLRPIRALQQAALQISEGKLDERVDPSIYKKDELGELALVFNDMAKKLSDNMSMQRRLLADVSHELRSPLARLNMAVALAEKNITDPSSLEKSLNRIEIETAKMDKLIEDVLFLSRAESGSSEKRRLSLREIVSDVINNAEFEATQKGLVFQAADIPSVSLIANLTSLQSAIENVIRNAIRYTNSMVSVNVQHIQDRVDIIVTDDGSGLQIADLEAIFSPFYRIDSARNRNTGGVGLGLAIAKAAVAAHNGEISAQNNTTGGLTVTITLPVIPE